MLYLKSIKKGKPMDEIESTYLAKSLPKDLEKSPSREIFDIYLPKDSSHPKVRIRKNGDQFEFTKKEVVDESDLSHLTEYTIKLTKAEFESLQSIEGMCVRKIRYNYQYKGRVAEIDVFLDSLAGLVLVEFEFENKEQLKAFEMPDFCLADVSQEEFCAGGKLCGRSLKDIQPDLDRFDYRKI
jgi:CYTH domain-containing protein